MKVSTDSVCKYSKYQNLFVDSPVLKIYNHSENFTGKIASNEMGIKSTSVIIQNSSLSDGRYDTHQYNFSFQPKVFNQGAECYKNRFNKEQQSIDYRWCLPEEKGDIEYREKISEINQLSIKRNREEKEKKIVKLLKKILKLEEEANQRSQRDFELMNQQLINKQKKTNDLYKPNEDYLTRDQVSEIIDKAIKKKKTMSKGKSNILDRNDEINLEEKIIQDEEEINDLSNFFIWTVINEGIKLLEKYNHLQEKNNNNHIHFTLKPLDKK